jgi:hypothetical protein
VVVSSNLPNQVPTQHYFQPKLYAKTDQGYKIKNAFLVEPIGINNDVNMPTFIRRWPQQTKKKKRENPKPLKVQFNEIHAAFKF